MTVSQIYYNDDSDAPVRDVITPSSPIRLPGIAGPVHWRAELDIENERVAVLEIVMPNGLTDTVTIDDKTGVQVKRESRNGEMPMTPAMKRQTLINARIISGVHLQLALENAVANHG